MSLFQLKAQTDLFGDLEGWCMSSSRTSRVVSGPSLSVQKKLAEDPDWHFLSRLPLHQALDRVFIECSQLDRHAARLPPTSQEALIMDAFSQSLVGSPILFYKGPVLVLQHRRNRSIQASLVVNMDECTVKIHTKHGCLPISRDKFSDGLAAWERALGSSYIYCNQVTWTSLSASEMRMHYSGAELVQLPNFFPPAVQQYALSWYNSIAGK